MTKFKKTILFIHRWLGFISGLVVFIVSVTGCIFCFQDEIQDATRPYRHVEVQAKPYLNPTELRRIAFKGHPDAVSNYLYYYGPDRPACVLATLDKKGPFMYVYINPYTGQLLHTEDLSKNFFVIVEYIHLYILLPPAIGKWVVGVSVIIFVALMITGIILWWPKRKSDRKRSLTIKWNGRWRRVNYDLHNVLGFYATSIALILALTGLAIAFEPVDKAIYKVANLGADHHEESIIPKSDSLHKTNPVKLAPIDNAFVQARVQSPSAQMFLISNAAGASGVIGISAYPKSLYFGMRDEFSFDQYSGKLLKKLPYEKQSAGMKLNGLNYDIHVGQALGLFGKIVAFLGSLICASLPVTGFIVWLGKRKKKGSKTRKVAHRRTHEKVIRANA